MKHADDASNSESNSSIGSVDKMCRTCLIISSQNLSIFDYNCTEALRICDMVMNFCSVKINHDDDLPTTICSNCIKDVEAAYNFKKKCERADNNLRKKACNMNLNFTELHRFNKSDVKQENNTEMLSNSFDDDDIIKQENESEFVLCGRDEIIDHENFSFEVTDIKNENNENKNSFDTCNLYEENDSLICQINPLSDMISKKLSGTARSTILKCKKVSGKFKKNDKSFLRNCTYCDFKTKLPSQLRIHMHIHTGEKPLACDICNFRCVQSSSLQNHKLTHTNEKPYKCSHCDYKCTNSSNLKRHMRKHTNDKPYSCDKCSYRCAQSTNLKEHQRIHTGEKPFLCDQCHYTCRSISALRTHKRNKHSFEKNFSCDECNFMAKTKSTLKAHKKTHSEVKDFSCDLCPYQSVQLASLENHKKMVHTGERPFACHQCPYRCVSLGYLKIHQQTHLKIRTFTCDDCTYSCYTNFKLKIHKLTHSGEKPYHCKNCDFKCASSSSLKRHCDRKHAIENHK